MSVIVAGTHFGWRLCCVTVVLSLFDLDFWYCGLGFDDFWLVFM